MRFTPLSANGEIHQGEGPGGTLRLGNVRAARDSLLCAHAGQARTIYLDPPFFTGKTFYLHQRVGEAGWATGKPMLNLPAYDDRWPDEGAYLSLLEDAFSLAHALLAGDGSLFIHIDARMHLKARQLADAIFGPRAFVNEIIWVYQSGGRSRAYFSRKHDTILFYRKSPGAYFNLEAVGTPRAKSRSNHMRRGVDDSGRAYRSIVSQGKEYRYYDDDLVFPSDVWDDVSHLQQKDPQRVGFDNQKPMKLLERVILSTSRPGDLVGDLFAGSGTTAAAAAHTRRRFFALDASPVALVAARKRLLGSAMRIEAPMDTGAPVIEGHAETSLGLHTVTLTGYTLEPGLYDGPLGDLDALDQVSVGYLRDDMFHAVHSAARSRSSPALPPSLELPVLSGVPALLTVDILGRRLLSRMEGLTHGE